MLTTMLKIPYLRLKYRFLPNKAQTFWAQELLNSQGLSAKIGQILAQGKVTQLPKSSLSPGEAKALFHQQFGIKVEVAHEALAASIGQVFFITLDQEEYALKILHPGIREKLRSEIDNILILGGYFAKAKGFHFNQTIFKSFLIEVFEEETDLTREAQFQEKFSRLFEGDERFKIPRVIKKYSSDSLLCQEKVTSVLAREAESFEHFHIFTFFFESLLKHGVLHGDLNDRNWGILGQSVAVYDYGCSQIISERRRSGFIKLLSNTDIIQGFTEFGIRLEATWFKGREQELRDALFEPLLNFPISPDLAYSELLTSKFGDKIKMLREFTDPWVLLMMRSLFSLIRIYQDRKIPIPLNKLVAPYLILQETPMKATNIKIEVHEGKLEIVSLRFPLTALENLEDLMPGKVASKIIEEGIEMKAIIQKVIASDYAPQDLFKLSIDERNYRVWIE
jgi:hypothetical protein